MRAVWLFLLLLAVAVRAEAHELRPAYLDLRETAPGTFEAVWKVPARGDRRLSLYARLPQACAAAGEAYREIEGSAFFERWQVTCAGGLKGQQIAIEGLSATYTDALVRIAYLDGEIEVARLTPDAPAFAVKGSQTPLEVASSYFVLGVEHILAGIDHLLFVLALLLLIHDWRSLLKAVTAFTVAHSITLSGAALGLFSLPQAPVEAVIALSIVFVAREVVLAQRGQAGLSGRAPWAMAFAFGLLHGFGFAGALREIGLPEGDVPLALLSFNLGVEAGQLLFVAGALALMAAVRQAPSLRPGLVRLVLAYGIGAMAMAWLAERLASFA